MVLLRQPNIAESRLLDDEIEIPSHVRLAQSRIYLRCWIGRKAAALAMCTLRAGPATCGVRLDRWRATRRPGVNRRRCHLGICRQRRPSRQLARLFELHRRLGVVGGNVVNRDDFIVDGCYMTTSSGALESPWTGRHVAGGGPFALALKTQSVTLSGEALAFSCGPEAGRAVAAGCEGEGGRTGVAAVRWPDRGGLASRLLAVGQSSRGERGRSRVHRRNFAAAQRAARPGSPLWYIAQLRSLTRHALLSDRVGFQ